MKNIPELFGSMVFNDDVMRTMLAPPIYAALRRTMLLGLQLDLDVANAVADAMKEWAISKGATHFTHWFQPMTGVTAEKHDSFIEPFGEGKVIMTFSGKSLVRGEPDASSFPSGGLRATFEARGYTVWDLTSYAFIKDDSLCIPTAFCSYSGEALDTKTPLLRSMDAVNTQALRILRLFGNSTATRVVSEAGAEQEYFLVDKEVYLQRPDLLFTGRTLLGARPSKGQELEDHYFGSLKPRVSAFMKELEQELWKLGVYAKTKHNEAAPGQHELTPIYTTVNVATDHNQITMELMKSIANAHGMACLLHEKPFAGVNGSGKHNNWSLTTDTGINLFDPGRTPHENAQFLLFLVAVIKGIDEYQDLLRITAASAGNDHRLGASEAPPPVMSIYLGDELTEILECIDAGAVYVGKEKQLMELGVTVLPHIPRDNTDRNRTSPCAFTGKKFEFRMLGSAFSIAGTNVVLNTITAEALRQFADELEKSTNIKRDLAALIKRTFHDHKRIVFNGNNYANEWLVEANLRGLSNHRDTISALPQFVSPKSVNLFAQHGIFTAAELHSRHDIRLDSYCKVIRIEALTMIDMVKGEIIPAVVSYQNELASLIHFKVACNQMGNAMEKILLGKISDLSGAMWTQLGALEAALIIPREVQTKAALAAHYRDNVLAAMHTLRTTVDELETLVAHKHWPFPSYAKLLYSVM